MNVALLSVEPKHIINTLQPRYKMNVALMSVEPKNIINTLQPYDIFRLYRHQCYIHLVPGL
jgi:hypothetical protein